MDEQSEALYFKSLTMKADEIVNISEEEATDSTFIIELIGYCDSIRLLQSFNDEVEQMFYLDKENKKWSAFEKTVVYENFHFQYDELLNKKK